jgi:hypothetical protein
VVLGNAFPRGARDLELLPGIQFAEQDPALAVLLGEAVDRQEQLVRRYEVMRGDVHFAGGLDIQRVLHRAQIAVGDARAVPRILQLLDVVRRNGHQAKPMRQELVRQNRLLSVSKNRRIRRH